MAIAPGAGSNSSIGSVDARYVAGDGVTLAQNAHKEWRRSLLTGPVSLGPDMLPPFPPRPPLPLPFPPHPPMPPPSAYSLAQWQTPIRDQGDRDSCWAFAGLAALEAAYKRQYGLELDLSEQYFFHICRSSSLASDYLTSDWLSETACSLWGAGGNSGSIASLETWWVCTEAAAPYQSQEQLLELAESLGVGDLPWQQSTTQEQIDTFEYCDQLISRAARSNCIYGVTSTAPVPDQSVDTIKSLLRQNREIVVDLLTNFTTDSTGRWIYQQQTNPGFHVFVIVGYDDNDEDGTFAVKNSWGGDQFTRVAYDFFTHSDAYYGGNYITGVVPPGSLAQRAAFWHGKWNQDHDGWRGTTVVRRTPPSTAPSKVGNYYRGDGTKLDINGWIDNQGLHGAYWIAENPGKIPPGSQTGQPFNTYVFNWDPASNAGTTVWGGMTFGAQLSLDPIPATADSAFSRDQWLGTWKMDHDGWQGQLDITQIDPPIIFATTLIVHAIYTPAGGSALPTTGYLLANAQHHLQLQITFSAANVQPFDLFHHVWETDVFSGTTTWGGTTFGAKGHRAD